MSLYFFYYAQILPKKKQLAEPEVALAEAETIHLSQCRSEDDEERLNAGAVSSQGEPGRRSMHWEMTQAGHWVRSPEGVKTRSIPKELGHRGQVGVRSTESTCRVKLLLRRTVNRPDFQCNTYMYQTATHRINSQSADPEKGAH